MCVLDTHTCHAPALPERHAWALFSPQTAIMTTTSVQVGERMLVAHAPYYEVYAGDQLTHLICTHLQAQPAVCVVSVYVRNYRQQHRRAIDRIHLRRAMEVQVLKNSQFFFINIHAALSGVFNMPLVVIESWRVGDRVLVFCRLNRVEFTLTMSYGKYNFSVHPKGDVVNLQGVKTPTACVVCGVAPPTLIECAHCKYPGVRYCGEACQKVRNATMG